MVSPVALDRYRDLLTDFTTYGFLRIEDVAWSRVMDEGEMGTFRERYLFYSTS